MGPTWATAEGHQRQDGCHPQMACALSVRRSALVHLDQTPPKCQTSNSKKKRWPTQDVASQKILGPSPTGELPSRPSRGAKVHLVGSICLRRVVIRLAGRKHGKVVGVKVWLQLGDEIQVRVFVGSCQRYPSLHLCCRVSSEHHTALVARRVRHVAKPRRTARRRQWRRRRP
jgi:hypothetical protein